MRAEIKSILTKLRVVKEEVEGYLDNAESAEYPNDGRIDRLSNEIDCIGEAIGALEEIE